MIKNKVYIILLLYFSCFLLGMFITFCTGIQEFQRVPREEFFNLNKFYHYIKVNYFAFILLILGLVTYKITTIVNIIVNGLALGTYIIPLILEGGASILIHAIPELSALFIAAYIGMSTLKEIRQGLIRYILFYFMGSLLIVLAAFLETYVTPIFF